jgi:YrbI family 3-deoxy-D-manno-octulosonate 8-phosphate phosphatase
MTASFDEKAAGIELLLLDVDGVLTDGRIIYGDDGTEIKAFHVRDGSGLKLWQLAGKKAGILTGRSSKVVERRARELGLEPVIQGAADKGVAFERLLEELKLSAQQVAFVGDDLPDLPVLRQCGLPLTVADACPEVREVALRCTQAQGGQGAVREIVEWLLKAQGRWNEVIDRFR